MSWMSAGLVAWRGWQEQGNMYCRPDTVGWSTVAFVRTGLYVEGFQRVAG